MNYLKIMINHVLDVFTPYFCADINDVIIMFLTFGNHQLKKNKYASCKRHLFYG